MHFDDFVPAPFSNAIWASDSVGSIRPISERFGLFSLDFFGMS